MTTPMPVIRQNGTVAQPENPERRGFSREDFTGGNTSSHGAYTPTDAQSLSGEIRPADLRDYKGPLFVINKMKSMISHDDGKGNVLRIEPVYHRDHIMQLPIEVALHPGFQRLWRTGRVQVTTDPAIEDYLSLDDAAEDKGGILDYTMDAGQNKDLTPSLCLVCEEQIFISKEDLDMGAPTLCDLHTDAQTSGLIEHVHDAEHNLVWKLKDSVKRR